MTDTTRPRTPDGRMAQVWPREDLHPDPTAVRRALRRILRERKRDQAPGPRTLLEVCAAAQLSPGDVSPRLGGMRPLPWAMVIRLARAVDVDIADLE